MTEYALLRHTRAADDGRTAGLVSEPGPVLTTYKDHFSQLSNLIFAVF